MEPQVGEEVTFGRTKYVIVRIHQVKHNTYVVVLRRKRGKRLYSVIGFTRNGQWRWAEGKPLPVPPLFA